MSISSGPAELNERVGYHACATALQGDYRALRVLAEAYGSWERAWLARAREFPHIDAEREWKRLEHERLTLILRDDEAFPSLLREIPSPPFGIYVRGNIGGDQGMRIAIVGTRKATDMGLRAARECAEELARGGVAIVSGLAFGIDRAAHEGAIDARGRTLAVLASGLLHIYPRHHEGLAERIVKEGGALISEYPPSAPSFPSRFIERNRIVSGLCKGVVVIEAPAESGALATARFALDQNREVCVVPGPARHPNYAGSHRLIKAGAALVVSAADVAELLDFPLASSSRERESSLAAVGGDEASRVILTLLKDRAVPLDMDAIAAETRLSSALVGRSIGLLLIQGIVKERGGRYML